MNFKLYKGFKMDEIVSSLGELFNRFQNNILIGIVFFLFFIWVWFNYYSFFKTDKNDNAYIRTISWVKNDTFSKRYLFLLNKFILFFSKLLGDRDYFEKAKPTKNTPKLFKKLFRFNPFTEKSFEKLITFSFIYTILSFYFTWVITGNGNFSGVNMALNEQDFHIRVYIYLIIITFFIMLIYNNKIFHKNTIKTFRITNFIILVITIITFLNYGFTGIIAIFVGISIGAIAGLTTITFILPSIVIVSVSIIAINGFNLQIAGTTTYNIFSANLLLGVFIGLLTSIYYDLVFVFSEKIKYKYSIIFFIVSVIIIDIAFALKYTNKNSLAFILLFSLLPIINAVYDWLSIGITRGLLGAIAKGYHKTKEALFWAGLDIFLAIVFLILISFTMIATVGIVNHLAGKTVLDLNNIFSQLETKSVWENFWIYFMLFSTLIPTYIHFVIAGLSLVMWLPSSWREWLVADLEKKDSHKHILTFLYVTITPIFAVGVAIFMGWIVIKGIILIFSTKDLGVYILDIAKSFYALFT